MKRREVINGIRVMDHIGLVHSVANRYRRRAGTLDYDDLTQAGLMGLMTGLERFDHERGVRVSTYVLHWIRHAIQRAIANESRTVRIPCHAWSRAPLPPPALSLDVPRRGHDDGDTWLEQLTSDGPSAEDAAVSEQRATAVRQALAELPERLLTVAVARFRDDSTLADIARALPKPVSRERARQLQEDALGRLRGALAEIDT